MTSSGQERTSMKIPRDLITHLGQPQQEAIYLLEKKLDSPDFGEGVSRTLIQDVCRHLLSSSGDAQAVAKADLVAQLHPKYSAEQVSGIVDHLISQGIILVDGLQIRLSSGVLAKLLHSKIQAETAGLQKAEAFIRNRYEYYQEKGQLLSEQDINYIGPFIADLVLREEHQDFIETSRAAIQKEKRRSFRVIAGVMALLLILAFASIYLAFTEREGRMTIELQKDSIEIERNKAMENLVMANRFFKEADSARQALQQSNAELEEATEHIQNLLAVVTQEKDVAVRARQFAEEQEEKARVQERIAKEQEHIAKEQEHIAKEQERRAKEQEDIAKARALEADSSRQVSDDLRSVLLSRIVAQRSLAMKESDGNLKAYTAMLAYHINDSVKGGDILHPDVFRAVYYAARNQKTILVPEAKDFSNGSVGSVSCMDPSDCVMGVSDGSVMQFSLDPGTGSILNHRQLFYLPDDAVRFVFPQDNDGSPTTAFVMGALDHILEIDLPHGTQVSKELRRIPLPGRQFVRHAARISAEELMIQTADGAVYAFSCEDGTLDEILAASDGALAWTMIPHLGLLCYATASNSLILTDRKRELQVDYAPAKKSVAQMEMRQYGNTIYLALGYTDGELEVFISNQEAFLSGYQGQLQGKNYYEIQSLRSSVHRGYISMMVFAKSRPLLAVSSYDGSVTIWDLQNWMLRRGDYQPVILDDHDDWVTACTFLPGDNAILSGSKLGTIKYWSLNPETYARGLCNAVVGEPDDEEWREYIGEELKKYRGHVCGNR